MAVCIGYKIESDNGNADNYFDFNTNLYVFPDQIIERRLIKSEFRHIESGKSCEDVASLFLNILKFGRSLIFKSYGIKAKSEILSFKITVHDEYGEEKLEVSDNLIKATANLISNSTRSHVCEFLDRTGFKINQTEPAFNVLDSKDDEYLKTCTINPLTWPDGWFLELFDTPSYLSLTVIFNRKDNDYIKSFSERLNVPSQHAEPNKNKRLLRNG